MVNKLLFVWIVLGLSFGEIISEKDVEKLDVYEEIFGIEPQMFEDKILEAINKLKDFLKNGDPSGGVQAIDPLFVSHESFDFVLKDTALQGFFQNTTVAKFSDFETQEIQFKLLPLLFKIQVYFHQLLIDGRYKLSGNLFSEIPVNGTGKFKSETKNMTLYLNMRMTIVNSSLQIKDITFEHKILKEMVTNKMEDWESIDFILVTKIAYVNEFEGNQVQVLDEKFVFEILDKIQRRYIPPLLNTVKLILNDFLQGYTFQQILEIIFGVFNQNLETTRNRPHVDTNFFEENEVMKKVMSLVHHFELDEDHL